jgi:ABC-type dipeptide/oligopeptide/nickel transport system ATPase component
MMLEVAGLSIDLPTSEGARRIVNDISFKLGVGETLGIVGESGSGKTMTALALMGLLPDGAIVSGSALFEGRDLAKLGEAEMRRLRGDRVAMIFQEAVSALIPTFTIGDQFREVLRRRDPAISRSDAGRRARAALADVHLHEPDRVLSSYVFQLSGGMSQRVMISLALANDPELLVADEPGSSLDVTVQARTLHLMNDLIGRHGTSVLFISHNLGVVREFADRVYVIYRGGIVEHATAAQLFANARHPYTRALLAAIPKLDQATVPDAPETRPDFADPLIEHPGCSEPHLVAA